LTSSRCQRSTVWGSTRNTTSVRAGGLETAPPTPHGRSTEPRPSDLLGAGPALVAEDQDFEVLRPVALREMPATARREVAEDGERESVSTAGGWYRRAGQSANWNSGTLQALAKIMRSSDPKSPLDGRQDQGVRYKCL
jgi:hypothetical protein